MISAMKRKILFNLLMIGIAAVIIGGATMAWFTDSAEVAPAEFTSGTVIVNADNPVIQTMPGKYFDNVNPGDCATVTWKIYNEGTKAAELRVKLTEAWTTDVTGEVLEKLKEEYDVASAEELEALLTTDNVHYAPAPGSDWVMYQDPETNDVWLYYTGGPVRGTYNPENSAEPLDPAFVELKLVVGFDGEATDNKYMGADFNLSGTVEAIQASNNAPSTVWGEAWDTVKAEDYSDAELKMYFLDGPGVNMECWKNLSNPPAEQFVLTLSANPAAGGVVSGSGTKSAGEQVTLTAIPAEGYEFVNWTDEQGNVVSNTNPYTMPNRNVTLTANFEEIVPEPVTYTLNLEERKIWKGNYFTGDFGTITGAGTYEVGKPVTLTARAKNGFKFKGWYSSLSDAGFVGKGTYNAGTGDWTYTYINTTAANGSTVTLYAVFEVNGY